MMQAFWLSERLGLVEKSTSARIQRLLEAVSLFPMALPSIPNAMELVALMRKDKKVLKADSLRFILPQAPIGSLLVHDTVPVADVLAVLDQYHQAI